MATQPQLAVEPDQKFVNQLSPWADILSKTVAAIAIAVYACGFLIVSLHHAKYGFIGTNPFRPRVLAAGAWFLFLAAIPISIGMRYRTLSWLKMAQNLYNLWVLCIGFGFTFSYFLFEYPSSPPQSSPLKSGWAWIATMTVSALILYIIQTSKKFPPVASAIGSALLSLLLAGIAANALFRNHLFRSDSISLWFFICVLVTVFEFKVRLGRDLGAGEWAKPLATLFVILLFFAKYYYPNIKASWGGGAPIRAIIYFSKDSAVSPNKVVSAQLIDESDEGFYVVGAKDSKAVFIPRSTVGLVYFSDNGGDSELVHEIESGAK